MRDSRAPGNALRATLFAVISGSVLGLGVPGPVTAETVVRLAPFRSVTLRSGGQVILRHGPEQRVTLLQGNTNVTGITIEDDDRLMVDRCRGKCPGEYQLVVDIVTPEISGIAVISGGTIQSVGSFPQQEALGAEVHHGGMIDLRSMTVDVVSASVQQGGRIFTTPRKALLANVAHGGGITYWGRPRVQSAVEHGGVVTRGDKADADKPLSEFGPGVRDLPPLPPLPPVAPVAPVPPTQGGGTL